MPALRASRRRLMRWARAVNEMARLDFGVGDCVYYYGASKHFADGNIEVTHGAMADVLSIDRAKGLVTVRFKQDVFVGRFASLLSSGVCMHARLFRRTPPPSIPKYPLGTRLFLQVWGEHDMSWKTLSDRLRYGWTAEQAVTTPVRMGNWTHREGKDREPTGTDITSIWLRKAWKL